MAFTGTVKLYDALDRGTWGAAVAGATSIARATAAFSTKNARFFAGYAFDAKQVPFAWTPPGRVFVGIDLERTALVDADGVQEGRGRWGGGSTSHEAFRRATKGGDPLATLPDEVRGPLGRRGGGALTLVGDRGPVVVPTRWRAEEHALYAALPGRPSRSRRRDPTAPAALTIDEPSAWRARDMVGAMVQSSASIYVLDGAGERREDRARARDRDRSRRRRARPARALAPRLVARLVERQRRPRMSTAEFSVEVDAPPERVWAVVSDPANIPHWERHVVSVHVPDAGLGEGSRYTVVMAFMGVKVTVRGRSWSGSRRPTRRSGSAGRSTPRSTPPCRSSLAAGACSGTR